MISLDFWGWHGKEEATVFPIQPSQAQIWVLKMNPNIFIRAAVFPQVPRFFSNLDVKRKLAILIIFPS